MSKPGEGSQPQDDDAELGKLRPTPTVTAHVALYVIFFTPLEASADGVARRQKFTFGPFGAVDICDDEIRVEEPGDGADLVLAESEGDGWMVDDGLSEHGTFCDWVRVTARRP